MLKRSSTKPLAGARPHAVYGPRTFVTGTACILRPARRRSLVWSKHSHSYRVPSTTSGMASLVIFDRRRLLAFVIEVHDAVGPTTPCPTLGTAPHLAPSSTSSRNVGAVAAAPRRSALPGWAIVLVANSAASMVDLLAHGSISSASLVRCPETRDVASFPKSLFKGKLWHHALAHPRMEVVASLIPGKIRP